MLKKIILDGGEIPMTDNMEKYKKNKVLTQKLTSGERKIATKLLKKLRLALVEAKGDK